VIALVQPVKEVKPRAVAPIVLEAPPWPVRTRVRRLVVRRGAPKATRLVAERTVTAEDARAAMVGYAVIPVRFLIYMWFSGKLIS